jgi:hypothetical protein
MQHKRSTLLLIAALLVPVPPAVASGENMFSLMFRMMLTMMNVMSGAMLNSNGWGNNTLGNNNWLNNFSNGLGGFNSFNMGMQAFPMMNGIGSPWSSFGGTPWNSMGMMPWSTMGLSPWNGMGGSPWSAWGNPWGRGWGTPYGGRYPGYLPGGGAPGWGGYGYPINYGGYPKGRGGYNGNSLINGRWYGNNGEILEIRGNRFHLQAGQTGLNGVIQVNNNIINMYSPQTNTTTSYTFMRNQTGLLLEDASGNVLSFTENPAYGGVRVF